MRNPKTTITGVILGGLMASQPVIENGDFNFKRDWLKLVISIGIFALGLLSKDHNKTGV